MANRSTTPTPYEVYGKELLEKTINDILAPIVTRLEAIEAVIPHVPRMEDEYDDTAADTVKYIDKRLEAVEDSLSAVASGFASHASDSEHHVSDLDRDNWSNKADRSEVYPFDEIDAKFASKASAESVTTLQSTKADKTDTYTKTQVDEKCAFLNGEEYDFSDWTNGALAEAIKTIFTKCGGTVVEG